MAGCLLRVTGEDLDVDAAIAATGLDVDRVFRRGEPLDERDPRAGTLAESGFTVVVSRRGGDALEAQVAEAIAFLSECHMELSQLAARADVEEVRLDFALFRRAEAPEEVEVHALPPHLLRLAGESGVGIELSIYTISDD